MTCAKCGTEIAEKAIVCYRCGAPTVEPRLKPPASAPPRAPRAVRLARWLWLVLAVVVWNVVFDNEIRMAGRRYLLQAGMAAQGLAAPVRMDEIMRPGLSRALVVASAAGGGVLLVGLLGVALAGNLDARRKTEDARRKTEDGRR